MEERMGIAQEAAIGFTRQLHKDDQAEVIDFDSQVRVLSPFTNDGATLEKAIRTTTANGSTSLYNAVYIALKDMKKVNVKASSANDIRRQAIVLLSDGDDTSSLIEFDEVLDLAKRSDTVIYSIGLRQGEIARREFKEAEFVLKQLSSQTGGRAYFPTDARELAKIYQSIWDELSSQYTMAYSSTNPKRDGAYRRVQVRLTKPGLTARTKQGYYGPTGS
jgi:Ca-activated chloride channel family protein